MKCLHCNLNLLSPHSKKFCSLSCSASFNNKGRQRNLKHGTNALKPCTVCGEETVKPKFCSKKCMGISKRKYTTEEERLQLLRAKRRADYKLYQARKKYQTTIGTDLQAIKEFYLHCPPGYEVDHIIPLSKGGAHDIKNLQYLTIRENRKKSNKIPS